jgi:hypothetical protein
MEPSELQQKYAAALAEQAELKKRVAMLTVRRAELERRLAEISPEEAVTAANPSPATDFGARAKGQPHPGGDSD